MADSPINGFPTTATDVAPGSFFGFDRWNGAAFETVKILGSDLASTLGAPNMANGDRTLTGDRTHNGDNKRWTLQKLKDFTIETSSAPTLGSASFNLSAFGNTAADITHRFSSAAGTVAEMYGDRSAKFNGAVGVNATPSPANYQMFVNSNLSAATIYGVNGASGTGVLGASVNGSGGRFTSTTATGVSGQSTSTYGGTFNGANGVIGQGATWGVVGLGGAAGVYAYSTGTGWGVVPYENGGSAGAMNCQGKALFNGTAATGSALVQIDSTRQGFLPPRMTAAQRTAIASPAIGLMVYQTDATEGVYVNTSGGWVQL